MRLFMCIRLAGSDVHKTPKTTVPVPLTSLNALHTTSDFYELWRDATVMHPFIGAFLYAVTARLYITYIFRVYSANHIDLYMPPIVTINPSIGPLHHTRNKTNILHTRVCSRSIDLRRSTQCTIAYSDCKRRPKSYGLLSFCG